VLLIFFCSVVKNISDQNSYEGEEGMGIIEFTKNKIIEQGNKATILSVNCLDKIKTDIEALKENETLNDFQNFIVNELYNFDFPETSFDISSIIMVAYPSKPANLTFNFENSKYIFKLPPAYIDKDSSLIEVETSLNKFLNPKGHYVKLGLTLPRKLLAVRSGLASYGRNNICYVEGMGSFLNIVPLYSNIPCTDGVLHDIRDMIQCQNCKICINACPTKAIKDNSFLIDNEKCLTYFNEEGKDFKFPDWINPSSHNSIYGCSICQDVCPVNKAYLKNLNEPFEFSEEETLLLLNGKPLELFSEELRNKVEDLNMLEYLGTLPRNLKVLINKNKNS
jgi:epoxyqueuosine reductase